MLPLILVAAVVAATLALTYGRGSFDLDRSAIGFEGLVAWLSKTGAEARTFIGGDRLTRERVGLRVYPLYDVGLGGQSANSAPRADPPPLFYGREVELGVVRTKIAALPTLIVLPKWRREVVDRGVVHPKLLIPQELIGRLAAAVAPDAGALLPRAEGFLSLDFGWRRAAALRRPARPGGRVQSADRHERSHAPRPLYERQDGVLAVWPIPISSTITASPKARMRGPPPKSCRGLPAAAPSSST